MSSVNWGEFEKLPGGMPDNFEMLCRALIKRHYGQYGYFNALANQPGVEFHLKLHKKCSLGNPNRWYGWQCRWYDIRSGQSIGTTRRKKIKEAIETSENKLSDLTDWVLWTRRPLTKRDQEWFKNINTNMRLHLWTAKDVQDHLCGPADIYRSTYFGELVFTPDLLDELHERAVAPIRRRWKPELHQIVDAERSIRQMLGEPDRWNNLVELEKELKKDAFIIKDNLDDFSGSILSATQKLYRIVCVTSENLINVHLLLSQGDLDQLRQELIEWNTPLINGIMTLPRVLRAINHKCALHFTNALDNIRNAYKLIEDVKLQLSTGVIAVLAEYGCGKTHLAAQLTSASSNRPAGVLLHGQRLSAGQSLIDLAHQIVIHGNPVPSMEALIEAVNVLGQSVNRRLPIIIDGLNEAEDPRFWKGALASLNKLIFGCPYVLLVCTLRTPFAKESLPPEIKQVEIPDFDQDTMDAIYRYFRYYRIDPADAELPLDLLKHPLTLNMFCEVTNPERKKEVSVEAIPQSLTALFCRYLDQVAERIMELSPRVRRYYEHDIRATFDEIGMALWKKKSRVIDTAELRHQLKDEERPWNESIINALEQNGVLMRVPGDASPSSYEEVIYDALAGHLIASSVLTKFGRTGLESWLKNSITFKNFTGSYKERHPLADDVFRALIGLVPQQLHREQLWQLIEEPLRTKALHGAANLDGTYLDARTVEELSTLVIQPKTGMPDLLDRLHQTRGAPAHPLNSEFLDSILRPMNVAERDVRWTEWLRKKSDWIIKDLKGLANRWRERDKRSSIDVLRARWVMWTLTSSNRELRDNATYALYWFGRSNPVNLFDLTLDSLEINDYYVPERMLAASYGISMAQQLPDSEFADTLNKYLIGLNSAFIGADALNPTSHWLARLYIKNIIIFAHTYHNEAIPDNLKDVDKVEFAPGPSIDPITNDDPRAEEASLTLHINFENYTVGRLFDDRSNYDMEHSGHQAAVAHVRGTVWKHGWRKSGIGEIDKYIATNAYRGNRPGIERYGKKYSWIGFYTYAGMLEADGKLQIEERLADLQIDPSFPEAPSSAPFHIPDWARPTPKEDRRWVRQGIIKVPNDLLYRTDIYSQQGPWIAVYGDLETKNQAPGRKVFGTIMALLVASEKVEQLVEAINNTDRSISWLLPEVPSDYYTFAGEIPWNEEFACNILQFSSSQPYREDVQLHEGESINVEILAHRYEWESYHSTLNEAGGALIPSKPFSAKYDLRGIPQSFSQRHTDKTHAAMSMGAPLGYDGHILFLREDLLQMYSEGRTLVWIMEVERRIQPYPHPTPRWLINAIQSRAQVWQKVIRINELSSDFD